MFYNVKMGASSCSEGAVNGDNKGDKNHRDTDLRSPRRKWTAVQSREFGDLHKTLAYLG